MVLSGISGCILSVLIFDTDAAIDSTAVSLSDLNIYFDVILIFFIIINFCLLCDENHFQRQKNS